MTVPEREVGQTRRSAPERRAGTGAHRETSRDLSGPSGQPGEPVREPTSASSGPEPPGSLWELALAILDPRIGPRQPLKWACLTLITAGAIASVVWSLLPEPTQVQIIATVAKHPRPPVIGMYPGVEVLRSTHIYDLSNWTVDSNRVESTVDAECRKVIDQATVMGWRVATSNPHDFHLTMTTHSGKLVEVDDPLMKRPNLSKYDVMLDIERETTADPFTATFSISRLGFSDPEAEWAGVAVMHPTKELHIVVRFPPDKPGTDFRYFAFRRSSGATKQPYEPSTSDIDQSESGVLRWRVPSPELGYAYRVDWEW